MRMIYADNSAEHRPQDAWVFYDQKLDQLLELEDHDDDGYTWFWCGGTYFTRRTRSTAGVLDWDKMSLVLLGKLKDGQL